MDYKSELKENLLKLNGQQLKVFYAFFRNLKTFSTKVNAKNKYYFPTVRGVKDYKSILDAKLRNFTRLATAIQNKDSINHYISLLNLEKEGLESFDIYREITIHEYFSNNNLNIITGGMLYSTIKSMLLGTEEERKLISEFQLFIKDNFFADYVTVQLARLSYLSDKQGSSFDPNDILMIDIMRGEIKPDDPRLQ